MRLLSLLIVLAVISGPTTLRAEPSLDRALRDYASSYAERLDGLRFVDGVVPGCGRAWHVDDRRLQLPATGPLVMDHGDRREHAVVLMHGLSDSPFFLCAIARAFHDAGANVVLPLLTGHGLAEPLPEAHAPNLDARWQADARAALAFAETRGERVSAGGLSTGGVLSVWLWANAPEAVDGGLFLFSAAFDFAWRLRAAAACAGTSSERATNAFRRWCHQRLVRFSQRGEQDLPWRWDNPYRNRFSDYGALELGLLRRATLVELEGTVFDPPLFIAHSVHDDVAPIRGVEDLASRHHGPAPVRWFRVDEMAAANCPTFAGDCRTPMEANGVCGVAHASVVLANPVVGSAGRVCEAANPAFAAMIAAAIDAFETLD